MLTAQGKLDQTLISWYDLLSCWATDGSLATTAEHVLNLDGENAIEGADELLQSYTSQWSLGDFESLPPIVLLSNDDISGARGAYAASTDTIYLNEDWLLTATESDIITVLTEELGAFLDDQLNTVDTQGDEGALFSAALLGVELSDAEVAAIQAEDDSFQITVDGINLEAESNLNVSESFETQDVFWWGLDGLDQGWIQAESTGNTTVFIRPFYRDTQEKLDQVADNEKYDGSDWASSDAIITIDGKYFCHPFLSGSQGQYLRYAEAQSEYVYWISTYDRYQFDGSGNILLEPGRYDYWFNAPLVVERGSNLYIGKVWAAKLMNGATLTCYGLATLATPRF